MTKEQAARLTQPHIQEILLAYAQGRIIEYTHSDYKSWNVCTDGPDPHRDFTAIYRIKVEPTYREWKQTDTKLGMILTNYTAARDSTMYLVVESRPQGLMIAGRTAIIFWEELLKYWKVTYDNGMTWQPCGVQI